MRLLPAGGCLRAIAVLALLGCAVSGAWPGAQPMATAAVASPGADAVGPVAGVTGATELVSGVESTAEGPTNVVDDPAITDDVDTTDDTTDSVDNTTDDSTDAVDNATDDTTDDSTDAVDNATDDTTDDSTDAVDNATDDTTDAVDNTTDDTTDAVDNTTDDTTDAVDNATDDTTDAVDNTTDDTTDTVENATDDTTDAVDNTTDDTTDAVDNTTDDTTDTVEESVRASLEAFRAAIKTVTDPASDLLGEAAESTEAVLDVELSLFEASADLAAALDASVGGDRSDGQTTTAGPGDNSSTSGPDGESQNGTAGPDDDARSGRTTDPAAAGSGGVPPLPDAPVAAGLLVGVTAAVLGGVRWLFGGLGQIAPQGLVSAIRLGAQRLSMTRSGLLSWTQQWSSQPTTPLRSVWRTLGDWLHRIALVAGYSRYDDSDPMTHDTRAALYEHIHDDPGSYPARLSERTDVPLSTLRYHLRILEEEELVETERAQGRKQYYPPGESDVRTPMGTARSVLGSLAGGTATVSELARRLDRDPSTITHHLEELSGSGLVERERDGRAVENRLTTDGRRALALADGSDARTEAAEAAHGAPATEGPSPEDGTRRAGRGDTVDD